ncbi:MAG: hypothetical protein QG597_4271 [Actinomycetota bacterium]|nr:hypothetical protein [Actinomycetota bacterium]
MPAAHPEEFRRRAVRFSAVALRQAAAITTSTPFAFRATAMRDAGRHSGYARRSAYAQEGRNACNEDSYAL